MSLAPLDLVSAHPWQRIVFTTYALSLSFFETVILDALVRGGASRALILADVRGVRASLSEQGAQRVGKDYEIEPVVVSSGVFHPKISILSSADECHVLVGSGNLTFGGWGGNCEILEHLHPSFAADAIADAADFFELMPASDRVQHHAAVHCAAIAADLRRSIQGRSRNGDIRLLHNLDTSISEQIAGLVDDLGGATQIVVAAPFWDDGAAIDRLCDSIGLDRVFVHAHAHGCVEGIATGNWPRGSRMKVQAVRLDILDTPEVRKLHAKAFEIMCRRGRVLVSGSANGTAAALDHDRNIETCIARVQRERTVGWSFRPAEPLPLPVQLDVDDETEDRTSGVLRAVLEADELAGEVMTPKMSGRASVYHLATIGPELVGGTMLGVDGVFSINAPRLEERSWRGGRIVIRVQDQNGRQAEGFVSVASFADITRRAGLLGRRLFAMLAGTETPADVAAIMAWFHEDPQRLTTADSDAIGGGADTPKPDNSEKLIPVATLSGAYAEAFAAAGHHDAAATRNWSRFIDQILVAFRDPRGPFGRTGTGRAGDDEDDENDNDNAPPPEPVENDPAIGKSLVVFERLFALLTKDKAPARNAFIAFDLTRYVCDRLQPEAAQAKAWLERLIKVSLDAGVPPDRRNDVAAAVLTLLANSLEATTLRRARDCLLRLNVDFSGEPPSTAAVRGFQSVLLQQATFAELWPQLMTIRTYPEQVRSYLQAVEDGKPTSDYSDLTEAREEWPTLQDAITSPQARGRLLVTKGPLEACPRCHIRLPRGEVQKLQSTGIATTKNCCHRVVIRTEA